MSCSKPLENIVLRF